MKAPTFRDQRILLPTAAGGVAFAEAGMNALLTKPFEAHQLRAVLERFLVGAAADSEQG